MIVFYMHAANRGFPSLAPSWLSADSQSVFVDRSLVVPWLRSYFPILFEWGRALGARGKMRDEHKNHSLRSSSFLSLLVDGHTVIPHPGATKNSSEKKLQTNATYIGPAVQRTRPMHSRLFPVRPLPIPRPNIDCWMNGLFAPFTLISWAPRNTRHSHMGVAETRGRIECNSLIAHKFFSRVYGGRMNRSARSEK